MRSAAEAIDEIRLRAERVGGDDGAAISEALDYLVGDTWHKLFVGPDSWSLVHPLVCRSESRPLHNCEVHTAVSSWMDKHDGPPIAPGEYPIHEVADVAALDAYLP